MSMDFFNKNENEVCQYFASDQVNGLKKGQVEQNKIKYGTNVIERVKKKSIFSSIIESLTEPMMIILIFSLIITFGTNLGKFLKTGEKDFIECIGILLAITLSVLITVFMEGSSLKAFNALNNLNKNVTVKVIRDGNTLLVKQEEVVCGDIIVLSLGDKIIADGRLLISNNLKVDESALTGESVAVNKNYNIVLSKETPLAERINSVYSGTFVTEGYGQMIVTAVGDKTELGKIATVLKDKKESDTPLKQKLNKLSKRITLIGGITAVVVFVLSVLRLALTKKLTFIGVQDAFITSIVLIVAAVPEGLPTIVAVSLALNMIKLAKENALIKKLIATETTGAVSVICSDKTGTLTENKMTLISLCVPEFCLSPERIRKESLFENFCINSTADLIRETNCVSGSATEGALLVAFEKASGKKYLELRKKIKKEKVIPFSSETKKMTTVIKKDEGFRILIKGAPEKLESYLDLSFSQKNKIFNSISAEQKKGRRVIMFAHKDVKEYKGQEKGFTYDGYAVISDPIRKDVFNAVKQCKKAHIKIKMLTGDNIITATAIAEELKIIDEDSRCVNASEIEKLSDEELKKLLPKIVVVARSTPQIKLRIVKLLKEMGEVVAVTGDGINDAPAIKQADVGISMGINGSETTKEASDVILLDDSFSTIVKAISFGRNVYKNLQRFIVFQLTVNVSAVLFIILSLLLGYPAPFNTLELLWINVIMDGPPALTLGLERSSDKLMERKPVKRNESIISVKMLIKIILTSVFIATSLLMLNEHNFLRVRKEVLPTAIFTMFILFQLFNAFNARELGSLSIFNGLTKNKIMLITFGITFLLHVFIVQVGYKLFGIMPLTVNEWLKVIGFAFLIVLISETIKCVYKLISKRQEYKKKIA